MHKCSIQQYVMRHDFKCGLGSCRCTTSRMEPYMALNYCQYSWSIYVIVSIVWIQAKSTEENLWNEFFHLWTAVHLISILWLNALKKNLKKRISQCEWRWRATGQQSDTGLWIFHCGLFALESCEKELRDKMRDERNPMWRHIVQHQCTVGGRGGWGCHQSFYKTGRGHVENDICSR